MGRQPQYHEPITRASASLMQRVWTSQALSDRVRPYEFLAAVNQPAAAHTMQTLTIALATLLNIPRIGEQLFEFEPHEVRRIIVGQYPMRYEIHESTIYVL